MKAAIAALASLPSIALACSLEVGFHEQRPFHFDVYHGDFYATNAGANIDLMRAIGGRGGCKINMMNLAEQPPFSAGTQAYLAESGLYDERHVVLFELPYQLLSLAPLPDDLSQVKLGLLSDEISNSWTKQFAQVTTLTAQSWQAELDSGKVDAVLWHPMDAELAYNSPLVRHAVTELPVRGMSLYYHEQVEEATRKQIADTLAIASDNVDFALNRYQLK